MKNSRPLWRVSVARPIPPQLFVVIELRSQHKTALEKHQSGTYILNVNASGGALLL